MGLREILRSFTSMQRQEFKPYDPNTQERAYFRELKRMYPAINRIYYPGIGDDFTTFSGLEQDFQIVSLDHESGFCSYYFSRKKLPNYVRGDADRSPFKDEAFDLLFIQDMDSIDYGDTFRTLRTGGIFLFSGIDCGTLFNIPHTDFDRIPNLTRIKGPDLRIDYYPFRKIGPVTQEDIYNILH